jgi:hypothetical protein
MKPNYLLALFFVMPAFALSQADRKLVAAIDEIANAALPQGPVDNCTSAFRESSFTS